MFSPMHFYVSEEATQVSNFQFFPTTCPKANMSLERSDATKKVKFSDVTVHHHDVLCTGLAASQGPALGLDWFSTVSKPVSLNEFEATRQAFRRPERELRMCPRQRKCLLVNRFCYKPNELARICGRCISPMRPR